MSNQDTLTQIRSARFATVFSLLLINFITICSIYFVVPSLEDFAARFGVSRGEVGSLAWLTTLGYSFANLFLGLFLKRFSLKNVVAMGLAGIAVSCFFMANATTFHVLTVGRFCNGFAAGLVVPSSWTYVFKYFTGEDQKKAVGLLSLDLMLAYLIGLPLGSYLVSHYGVLGSFSVAGIACALGLLSVLISLPSDETIPREAFSLRAHFVSLGSFLRDKTALRYLALIALWSFGYNSLFSYLGIWTRSAAVPATFSSTLFFIFGTAASLGCLYSARISNFRITARLLGGALGMMLLATLFSTHALAIGILLSGWFFFDRAVFTHIFSQTARIHPTDVAQFTTLVLLALLLASTVGTAAVGPLLDYFPKIGWVLGGVYLLSVSLAAGFPYRRLVKAGKL